MKPLFNKVDIFNVLEHQKQGLKEVFQAVTNAELDADPVAVASRLLEEFGINVPVLEEDKKVAETKEAQVDVSRDPTRFIRDRSRPFYVGGTEITVIVPFRGERASSLCSRRCSHPTLRSQKFTGMNCISSIA